MTVQKKPKPSPSLSTASKKVEADNQDEIDQIMNEIEQLQQEMAQTQKNKPPAPKLRVLQPEPAPAPQTEPDMTVQAEPAPADAAEPAAEVTPMAEEEDILKEFQQGATGGDGPSMEETLADLREEGSPTGQSLLDDPAPETTEAAPEAAPEEAVMEAEAVAAESVEEAPAAEVAAEATEVVAEEVAEEPVHVAPVVHAPVTHAPAAVAVASGTAVDDVEQAHAQHDDEDAEQEEPVRPAPVLRSKRGDSVMPQRPHAVAQATGADQEQGSLTMTLTGNMTLRLQYQFEGQEVIVGFSDNALRVQLADDTEFKVPIKKR